MKMQMAFVNRTREIAELRNYLCTPANPILFLQGLPKRHNAIDRTFYDAIKFQVIVVA